MNKRTEIDEERSQLSVDLANEDDLGAVVRGHIRIESLLVRYINAKLKYPKHIESQRFGYYERSSLALALGLRGELKGPLRALGSIRNDFAHSANVIISEKNYIDFISSFSKGDKSVFEKSIENLGKNTGFDINKLTHRDLFRGALSTLWAACRVEVKFAEESKIE